jgi:hypothetical protein
MLKVLSLFVSNGLSSWLIVGHCQYRPNAAGMVGLRGVCYTGHVPLKPAQSPVDPKVAWKAFALSTDGSHIAAGT